MRYQREKSQDWVEIEGAAELELIELDALYAGDITATQATVTALVKDCCFTNRKGEPVDARTNYRRLTHPQWEWLRKQIIKATLDEVADPEA
jgi:hypothetical protein